MNSNMNNDHNSPIRVGLPLRSSTSTFGPMHEFPRIALKTLQDALKKGFPKQLLARPSSPEQTETPTSKRASAPPEVATKDDATHVVDHAKQLLTRDVWSEKGVHLLEALDAKDEQRTTWSEFLERQKLTLELENARAKFDASKSGLEPMTRELLEDQEVFAYVFARAWFVDDLQTVEGAYRQMVRPTNGGWRHIYAYAVRRSIALFRDLKDVEFKNKELEIEKAVLKDNVSLSANAFERGVKSALASKVVGADVDKFIGLIKDKTGELPPHVELALKKALKNAPHVGDTAEAPYVAYALELTRASAPSPVVSNGGDVILDDYAVDYFADSESGFEFDRTSVEAAAQLFYATVLGDELGVFEVIDKIVAQAAPHLELRIRSKETAQDLQLYAFDEKFRDLKTGTVTRRLSREERQMFFQQVFGADEAVTGGLRVNNEFRNAWKQLMVEVARYIAARQQSRDGLVSPQKVRQAIEELRYCISNAASGMAKVAAPLINAELNFVVKRLLESNDVLDQLGRGRGRSFIKVVETVRGTQNLTPLYNKARYGHQIISTIAREALETTESFDSFVALVEGYIVAMEQLGPEQPLPEMPGMPGEGNGAELPTGVPGMNGAAPQDGWNF
jgi:hypothetical protein